MMKMVSHFKEYGLPYGLVILAVGLVILLGNLKAEEERRWKEFAIKHDCKIVERIAASNSVSTGLAIGANGQAAPVVVNTHNPEQTGYLCNDGVTYWR